MDTELSMEFALEIKGAPAEHEGDLKQLLEEANGGQPAATFRLGPLTYMNENLLSEEDLKELLEEEEDGGQPAAPLGVGPLTYMNENLPRDLAPAAVLRGREGPYAASTVGLIVQMDSILLDMPSASGESTAPLGPLTCSQDKSCLRGAPSASEGRRTTKHWESEEVNRLIAGVEEFGQSAGWSEIKEKYFPNPYPTPGVPTPRARTPGDLKDKWRNLWKACTGDAQRRCYQPPNSKQIKRIKKILAKTRIQTDQ